MKIHKQPKVPGFKCTDAVGRVYFVPLEKVRADYISFLVQADGISCKKAAAQADKEPDFFTTWFYEQFNWNDVRRTGLLIKGQSAKLVQRTVDFFVANFDDDPIHTCQTVGIK